MSHKVITTDAFVIHTSISGEYDRRITLFTREKGRVDVFAKSIRKQESKLKGIAYPYRYINCSLICGRQYIFKEGFVIDTLDEIWGDDKKRKAYVSMLRNIYLLLTQEQKEENIFDSLVKSIELLKENKYQPEDIELVYILSLLYDIGYLDKGKESMGDMLLSLNSDKRKKYTTMVKDAMKMQSI